MRGDTNGDMGSSGWWGHDPYGYGWGQPHGSFRSLEVSSSGDFSNEPAMFRIHQWGSGAAEFWKPKGTILYLRETPGGGSTWFTKFEVQGSTNVTSSLQAYSIQGNSNVAGTGNASYHPSGIYSTGTNWLYGTMYMNNNSIYDVINIYNNGWFRNMNSNQGLYNQAHDTHFYSSSSGQWNFATSNGSWTQINLRPQGHDTTIRGSLYANTSNEIGLLTYDGNWALRINSSRNAYIHGTDLTIGYGQSSSNIYMYDGDETTRRIHCNSNRVGFLTSSHAWGSYCDNSGNWISDAAIYSSNYFRSYGNTGWYNQDYSQGLVANTPNSSYGTVKTIGGGTNGWNGYTTQTNYIVSLMINSSGDHGFHLENGRGWSLFHNYSNNCWGIGTDNTYSGDGFRCIKYGSAEYGFTTWSDRRAKENIYPITGALNKVLGMNGVYYNYIKDEAKSQHVGFIAQDLLEVLPQSVRYAEDIDEYNINYGPIVSVLAEAIKEQNIEIQSLKAQLQTLLN
jgi:hypothetical protein